MKIKEKELILEMDVDDLRDSQSCLIACHAYDAPHIFGKKNLIQYKNICNPGDGHSSQKVYVENIEDCEDHYNYCLGDCHSECKCQERP